MTTYNLHKGSHSSPGVTAEEFRSRSGEMW